MTNDQDPLVERPDDALADGVDAGDPTDPLDLPFETPEVDAIEQREVVVLDDEEHAES